jgi:hypothetical protein
VIGGWVKLHNEELRYSSPSISRMRWARNVARITCARDTDSLKADISRLQIRMLDASGVVGSDFTP